MSAEQTDQAPDPAEYMRARDIRAMGLSRTDADFVMRRCGRRTQFGRSVYVRREDVARVLAEFEKRWDVAS